MRCIKMNIFDKLGEWSGMDGYRCCSSAQGASCGAADPDKKKPSACGSSCGAADPDKKKPSACGSACGAGDPKK